MKPHLHFFDLAQTPPVPWKNGGGTTRQLVCWPPAADTQRFEWRVSVATIASPGPFSAFPGVDRQIMLLNGDGVQLESGTGRWRHALHAPWQPFGFSGDDPVDCTLLGAPSTDFNLMLRRDRWRGGVEVVRSPCTPGTAPAGLCMVLHGTWEWPGNGEIATRQLRAGQGFWWVDESPARSARRSAGAAGRSARCGRAGLAAERARLTPLLASTTGDPQPPPALAWVQLQHTHSHRPQRRQYA